MFFDHGNEVGGNRGQWFFYCKASNAKRLENGAHAVKQVFVSVI
jgi:hypothetical protein